MKNGEELYSTNHLLVIDDLKLMAYDDRVLKMLVNETKTFFDAIGL